MVKVSFCCQSPSELDYFSSLEITSFHQHSPVIKWEIHNTANEAEIDQDTMQQHGRGEKLKSVKCKWMITQSHSCQVMIRNSCWGLRPDYCLITQRCTLWVTSSFIPLQSRVTQGHVTETWRSTSAGTCAPLFATMRSLTRQWVSALLCWCLFVLPRVLISHRFSSCGPQQGPNVNK